jgi:hypothetical protein
MAEIDPYLLCTSTYIAEDQLAYTVRSSGRRDDRHDVAGVDKGAIRADPFAPPNPSALGTGLDFAGSQLGHCAFREWFDPVSLLPQHDPVYSTTSTPNSIRSETSLPLLPITRHPSPIAHHV